MRVGNLFVSVTAMISLKIWLRWRLLRQWVESKIFIYPDEDDEWVEQLREWNKQFRSEHNLFRENGVLYKRTWAGVFKV